MSDPAQSHDSLLFRRMIGLGLASGILYVAIAVLSRRFELAIPSAQRPHLAVFAIFAVLFGCYLAALQLVLKFNDSGKAIRTVVLFALAYRLILLGTTPIQEVDLYRYVWDGNAVLQGVNPYRYTPQAVISAGDRAQVAGEDRTPDDSLQRLVAVEQGSASLRHILRTIHFSELSTPYPPVTQAVFAIAAATTPDDAAIPTHLVVMKAWIVLFDLLTIAAMIGLLRAVHLPVGWCLAYAWCPLVVKEFANSGHLDTIAVCLTTAALGRCCRVAETRDIKRRTGWKPVVGTQVAATFLGLAIGAKLYPVVLLPVCVAWFVRKRGWRTSTAFMIGVVVISGLSLWPMLGRQSEAELVSQSPLPNETWEAAAPAEPQRGLTTVTSIGSKEASYSHYRLDPHPDTGTSGLTAFLTQWRMNDCLFLIVIENLDPSMPKWRQPWFAVVPDDIRMTLVTPFMQRFNVDAAKAAFLLARGLTLGIFGLIAGGLCWRVVSAKESTPAAQSGRGTESVTQRSLEVCFLSLAWFWLLAPTQNPWYWTWCLPLIPFARSRVWLWVAGLAMVYYLRFWLNAHWPQPPGPLGSRHSGASFFDVVVVFFEYGPIFIGLFLCWLIRRRQQ